MLCLREKDGIDGKGEKGPMNCGLSNLATLKAFVLSASLQSNTSYDVKLAAIGNMVAALFNQYCNRQFQWGVGVTDIFTGDRPQWYVNASPIATNNDATLSPQITSVNMRYFLTDAWTSITGEPLQCDPSKGLISFGYTLGRAPLQVQVIYNGGYFYETKESTAGGYPTAQPAGSTALPLDLQGAFLLQVAEVWKKIDRLGSEITGDSNERGKFQGLDLVPLVKQMLNTYVRYQMS
jgi:hypothetical protein